MIIYGFDVRYRGPTNIHGSRISVRSSGGRWKTFAFDHAARCAFQHAVAQYIAQDRARPENDRRFAHPPDGGWTFRTVFETTKGYVIVAYWGNGPRSVVTP